MPEDEVKDTRPYHQWRRIRVEEVDLTKPEDFQPGLAEAVHILSNGYIVFLTGPTEERIGCWACNLSVAEAWNLPCPGRPLDETMGEIFGS